MFKTKPIRNAFFVMILMLFKSTSALAFQPGNHLNAVSTRDFDRDQVLYLAVTNHDDSLSKVSGENTSAQSSEQADNNLATIEQRVHQKINAYRVSKGLATLTFDAAISDVARVHSQNMASGTVDFGHAGFQSRIQTLAQTLSYRSAGENVASNWGYSDPGATAVDYWLKSTLHHANIAGNYRKTGIGVAKSRMGEIFFTQIFWY